LRIPKALNKARFALASTIPALEISMRRAAFFTALAATLASPLHATNAADAPAMVQKVGMASMLQKNLDYLDSPEA
jgi:hypothetical protein